MSLRNLLNKLTIQLLQSPHRLTNCLPRRFARGFRVRQDFGFLSIQLTASQIGQSILHADQDRAWLVAELLLKLRRGATGCIPTCLPLIGRSVDGHTGLAPNQLDGQSHACTGRQIRLDQLLTAERLSQLVQPPLSKPFQELSILMRDPLGANEARARTPPTDRDQQRGANTTWKQTRLHSVFSPGMTW